MKITSPSSQHRSRKRPATVNNACTPCRKRKVKCDAAVTGFPCSSCTSRQCVEECATSTRKARCVRQSIHRSASPERDGSQSLPSPPLGDTQSPNRPGLGNTDGDLLYLTILHETVDEAPASNTSKDVSRSLDTLAQPHLDGPGQVAGYRLSHLDQIDVEYLAAKGAFELPAPNLLYVSL